MRPFVQSIQFVAMGLSLLASACAAAPSPSANMPDAARAQETPTLEAPLYSEIPLDDATLVVQQIDGSRSHWLMPVDPRTGATLEGYDAIELGVNFFHRLTPDRHTLVILSYFSDNPANASLRFLDLQSWIEQTGLLLPTRGWTSSMAISADGSRLAFATVGSRQSSVWLVDLPGHTLMKRVDSPGYIAEMEFTGDNQALMLYVQQENTSTGASEGPPRAEYRSAQTLELLWSRVLDNVRDGFEPYERGTGQPHEPGTGATYRPAVVFNANTSSMYVLHAQTERITGVDFERRTILTQDIRPRLSWLERLLALGMSTAHAKVQDGIVRAAVISPDGEVAYTTGLQNKLTQDSGGSWELRQARLPLQAIRLREAAEVYRSGVAGDTLDLSSDGEALLVARWESSSGEATGTTMVATSSGEIMGEVHGIQLQFNSRIGGSPLLVSTSFESSGRGTSTLAAYDLDTLLLGSWQTPRYGDWIILP